jgi:hypothetical protein
VKFKLIPSMSHNWTHSFMSGINYVDGRFVFEDIYDLARKRRGDKVTVSWIPPRDEELFRLTPRVRKCIRAYRKGLRQHIARHRVDFEALEEMRTEVYVGEGHRMYVRAYARDNRGKEHQAFVWV